MLAALRKGVPAVLTEVFALGVNDRGSVAIFFAMALPELVLLAEEMEATLQ